MRRLDRYTSVAILLHWLIAALIAANVGLAWYFNTQHGLAKLGPLQIHKSIGITVLVLSLARLLWRFTATPPPLPTSMNRLEKLAAHAVHALLYAIMIGMPLTGWATASASKLIKVAPITWFGLFKWPAIDRLANLPPAPMKQAHDLFDGLHSDGAWVIYVLVAGHVAAALWHRFGRGDAVLWRMAPIGPKPA
ncbi:MAG TPA: cytochrome b [Caulobacteraceae bacterium]|jgi:cytochrome b561